MEKARYINRVIPELIKRSDEYRNEVKKRIKVNAIISEFNYKTSGKFRKFLNESDKRYKLVGNIVDNLIQNSQSKYNTKAMEILNDKLYELDIQKEKQLMKEKSEPHIMMNIKNLMSNIKSTFTHKNKPLNKIEIRISIKNSTIKFQKQNLLSIEER